MNDKLQQIKQIKAGLKSALISCGKEPTDVFSTYPDLIKTCVEYRDNDRDLFFELVDNESISRFIEEDGKYYKVAYQKYKYKYSDSIFVTGPEISREETEVQMCNAMDVVTTDNSEIAIHYTDANNVEQVLSTTNGLIQLPKTPIIGKVTQIDNWNKVVDINTINTDILPGDVQSYTFSCIPVASLPDGIGSNNTTLKNVYEWICEDATDIQGLFYRCAKIETVNLYVSSKLTNMSYICRCPFTTIKLKKFTVTGSSNCTMFKSCFHEDGGAVKPDEMSFDLSSAVNLSHFMCRFMPKVLKFTGKFSNNVTTWENWNYDNNTRSYLEEIQGLDISNITSYRNFRLFNDATGGFNSCFYNNLTKCKIKGLGVGTNDINCGFYVANSKWQEEDIIWTFERVGKCKIFLSEIDPETEGNKVSGIPVEHNNTIYICNHVRDVFDKNAHLYAICTARDYLIYPQSGSRTGRHKPLVGLTFAESETNKERDLKTERSLNNWVTVSTTDNRGLSIKNDECNNENNSKLGVDAESKANIIKAVFNLRGTTFTGVCADNFESMTHLWVFAESLNYMFCGYSDKLEEIYLDIDDMSQIDFDYRCFVGCTALTSIIGIDKPIKSQSIDFGTCPLNHETAVALINNIEDNSSSTAKTIRFSSSTYSTLKPAEIKTATDKNYTIIEV